MLLKFNNNNIIIIVELCIHIPCVHIAQCTDLLSVHGYNFVNFRKVLLSCTGGPGDKKHSLHPDLAQTRKI